MTADGTPPLQLEVTQVKPYRANARTFFLNLSLRNPHDSPRWYVMRAYLQDPLAETFEADVVQACGFEENPRVYYLQALGDTGCIAFQLAGGASLAVETFAFRVIGDEPGFELWEVDDITLPGERPAADCFSQPLLISGAVTVPAAHKRITQATFEDKCIDVTLVGARKWTLELLDPSS